MTNKWQQYRKDCDAKIERKNIIDLANQLKKKLDENPELHGTVIEILIQE